MLERNSGSNAIHIPVNRAIQPCALSKASELSQVDHSGKVSDGGPNRMLNAAAFMIHSAIHASLPNGLCAAHSHDLIWRLKIHPAVSNQLACERSVRIINPYRLTPMSSHRRVSK
jgi:hypothetical protein